MNHQETYIERKTKRLKHQGENVLCKSSASSRAPIRALVTAFATGVVKGQQARHYQALKDCMAFQIIAGDAKRGKKKKKKESKGRGEDISIQTEDDL